MGEYLISEGKIENYINFIVEGTCRAFYIKNGIEYNYEIGLEDDWVSSYKSLPYPFFKHRMKETWF